MTDQSMRCVANEPDICITPGKRYLVKPYAKSDYYIFVFNDRGVWALYYRHFFHNDDQTMAVDELAGML
jgi:hypothetical protein